MNFFFCENSTQITHLKPFVWIHTLIETKRSTFPVFSIDMMNALTFPIVALLFQILGPANGFSCRPSWSIGSQHSILSQRMAWALASSASSTPNEFSRPLNTDRILKTSSGKQRRTYREYETTIEATPDECLALAQRFDLRQLSSLQAELSLSLPPHLNSATTTTTNSYLTVQVEGSILANITQTCVRTNEDFDMTVEFPVLAIVKPVSFNNLAWKDVGDKDPSPAATTAAFEKKKTKSKNSSRSRKSAAVDMADLQQLIEEQSTSSPRPSSSKKNRNNINNNFDDFDDDGFDYFGAEEIVEDESIYSATNGILDVGELVAQTFYLNLDRYPKKPGTGPLEYTISG